jgi:hypothetical protein
MGGDNLTLLPIFLVPAFTNFHERVIRVDAVLMEAVLDALSAAGYYRPYA